MRDQSAGSATRRATWAAGLFVGVVAVGSVGTIPAIAEPPGGSAAGGSRSTGAHPDRLGGHDRTLLAQARTKHEQSVTVILAGDATRTESLVAQIERLGGIVTRSVSKIGYVRAAVPTDAVERVAALAGVDAVDLNESIPLPKSVPDTTAADLAARPAPNATPAAPGNGTPADNPYLPTGETRSVAFKNAHPTWDGRGVTIGVLDSGISLDIPALQTTSTGERKIVDWVTETDPAADRDGTWRPMLTAVSGPSFAFGGTTWKAPPGHYLTNSFAESITAADQLAGDVNRDGDTTDAWGILYDPVSRDIRVNVNQNHDFTDERVMRPYKERFDVGHFGVDNPATPVLEQVPFVVEYREGVDLTSAGLPGRTADVVNIGITENEHGSHVAGIAAGNDLLGNPSFDGQAPGAKLVSARACTWGGNCTAAALTDGLVDLVVNRHVDVVNMSIGGLPALNDGAGARAELYNRLIDDFGVQLFISAGNDGPGVNTVADPSVASDAVSVAASVSKASWLANYGSVVKQPQSVFPFSARGPREDGGFKPNLTAPGSAISTIDPWLPGAPVAQAGYTLPPGYAMLQGTSMAAPEATGAGALLLSAARAQDRAVTPAQLRAAMYSTARFLPNVSAIAEGNGLADVPAAWAVLKTGPQTRTYTSVAPVCTALSSYLTTPGQGTGILNNCAATSGGQKPGQARSYDVTITRMSGPAGPLSHTVSWIGDDGTFSSASRMLLPLGKPVTIAVRANPTLGAHSAIMRIDDPTTSAVNYAVMNTVVASAALPAPLHRTTLDGSVRRNATTSYFVTVPDGAQVLQVNLSGIATGSQTRWIAYDPRGVPVDSNETPLCYTNYSDPKTCNPVSRAYADPLPGVWELEVEARRTSPSLDNPYRLDAEVEGVVVTPPVVRLASVARSVPRSLQWKLTNGFGPLAVHGVGGPLGSSVAERVKITDGGTQNSSVVVPSGASRLEVGIGNASDAAADLDLAVVKDGVVVAKSAGGDAQESVSIADPAPGTYDVVVTGYSVPAGSTGYDYVDAFYSAALGSLEGAGPSISLGVGDTATITASLRAAMAPDAGRRLVGQLSVATAAGAVVGRGLVQIGAVTG